jgi:putative transposase
MQKFQGKYRIETARAEWWDYSNEGDYFITICTKNREHLFGYVKEEEMILNEYGQIVSDCWFDLPNHYKNIILGEFQVMPNHIHCIVGVDNSKIVNPNSDEKIHGVFEFMRALKSFSSRRINEKRNSKGVSNWQERFHDHIIRNEAEYNRIKNYIINNPKNWDKDCFFSGDT